MTRPAAVIFDLDGVLADTEPVFCAGLRQMLAPAPLSDEQYASIIGISNDATWRWVKAAFGRPESVEELHALCRPFTDRALDEATLPPLEGAVALLSHLEEAGAALAIASQSSRRWISTVLEKTGLAARFDVIVTAADVAVPKPAPDIYLYAAARLGVDPRDCVAVEDSVPGIASAAAAGMRVVQLRQAPHARSMAPHTSAHLTIDSHQEFPRDWFAHAPG